MLALAGALAGVLVAVWGTELLQTFYGVSYAGTNLNLELRLNPAVLGFMLVLAAATSVLFGLVPALRSSRANMLPALKDEGRGVLGSGARGRDLLVIAQVALAVVLLTGATLLVRSARYIAEGPGFDATRIALFRLRPALVGFDRANARRFQTQVIHKLEQVPGVVSASPASYPPLPRWGADVTVSWPGGGDDAGGAGVQAGQNLVGARYFDTLSLVSLRGREFTTADTLGSQPVALINDTLARRLWRDGDAIGRAVAVGGRHYQIVGVVPDAQYSGPAEPAKPFIYFNYWQSDTAPGDAHILVRTQGDARTLLPTLRAAIASLDPDVPIAASQRLSDRVEWEFGAVRALRTALVWFAAVGTLLSAIGLYGLLSFTVSLRARELSVRVALGARPRDLVRQVAARSTTLMVLGIGVGLWGALAAARLLDSLMYGVDGIDLMTLAAVSLALALVTALASCAPARRVARVDPAAVFRVNQLGYFTGRIR